MSGKLPLETVQHFPELVDFYIKLKEDTGDGATSESAAVVELCQRLYERQFSQLPELLRTNSGFYNIAVQISAGDRKV